MKDEGWAQGSTAAPRTKPASSPSPLPWFDHLVAADLVFLDDLGKGHWTENTEALRFDLIEHRTSQGKPVLVTTNYTGDELIQGSRGEATAYAIRRLRDYCQVIALDDPTLS